MSAQLMFMTTLDFVLSAVTVRMAEWSKAPDSRVTPYSII